MNGATRLSVWLALTATALAQSGTPAPQPDLQLDSPSGGVRADATAKPATPAPREIRHLGVGTEIRMHTSAAVSSGLVSNGAVVAGVLDGPLRTTTGEMLPRGARVDATVVSAAGAGVIQSGGVLSLQLTQVAGIPVITDVREFTGAEGHKDVADSAPQKGAEAIVSPHTVLTFHVLETGRVPGMDGTPVNLKSPPPKP